MLNSTGPVESGPQSMQQALTIPWGQWSKGEVYKGSAAALA